MKIIRIEYTEIQPVFNPFSALSEFLKDCGSPVTNPYPNPKRIGPEPNLKPINLSKSWSLLMKFDPFNSNPIFSLARVVIVLGLGCLSNFIPSIVHLNYHKGNAITNLFTDLDIKILKVVMEDQLVNILRTCINLNVADLCISEYMESEK